MPDPTIIASRCWRFQAFTDYQAVPRIEWLRESVRDFGGGDVIRKPLPTVTRALADIATAMIPGGPRTVTTAQDVFELVAEFGHLFAAEDDARAAAAAAAAAEPKAEG